MPDRLLRRLNTLVKWGVAAASALAILVSRDALVVWVVAGACAAAVMAKLLKCARKPTCSHSRPSLTPTRRRYSLQEARPTGQLKSPGMPSSHSCVLFCFAVQLCLLSPPLVGGLALGLAAGTAWSRVRLRFHTAAQVVVGSLLGAATGLAWQHLAFYALPLLLPVLARIP